MATLSDYELNPPKKVRQKDLDTCWACCMSAVLAANQSAKQASESELGRQYATTPTGGIDASQLQSVAKAYDYLCNVFQKVADARSVLTAKFFIDILKNSGMLMAAWRVHDPKKPSEVFFHAQIVYGVSFMMESDIGTTRALLHTMNPWTAAYEAYPIFSVFRDENTPIFTVWPKHGTP